MRLTAFIFEGRRESGGSLSTSGSTQIQHISPARGPPRWDDCDARTDEAAHIGPDRDLAAQVAPDYEVDQCISWRMVEAAILTCRWLGLRPTLPSQRYGLCLRCFLIANLPHGHQLLYYPTVTRESCGTMGRATGFMESGKMFEDLNLPALDAAHDRVMICGNPHMLQHLKHMLEKHGSQRGQHPQTGGGVVIEHAFAQQ